MANSLTKAHIFVENQLSDNACERSRGWDAIRAAFDNAIEIYPADFGVGELAAPLTANRSRRAAQTGRKSGVDK